MTGESPRDDTRTIIGVDPGYDRCGFAVIAARKGARETLLYSACFMTNRGDPFPTRLAQIGGEFERLCTTYKPTVCGLERVFFVSNQKTAMHVAEVRGVLLYIAHRSLVPVLEFNPTEIKMAVAGSGHATKNQVMAMVPRLITTKERISYDDEYDAIAIALTTGIAHSSASARTG